MSGAGQSGVRQSGVGESGVRQSRADLPVPGFAPRRNSASVHRLLTAVPGGSRRTVAAVIAAVGIAAMSGCGQSQRSSGPSPEPSSGATAGASPTVGLSGWQVADIEQPSTVTEAPSSAPVFCSPCHAPQADLLFAVARTSVGLVAVGIERPVPTLAAVWISPDGRQWSRVHDFPAEDGTGALAVAADGARVVIVGADRRGGAAWSSTDGRTWTRAPRSPQLEGPDGGTGMFAVTTWRGGFLAGGHRDDPAHAEAHAAVWHSADGLAWQRGADDPPFAGARILGLAATDSAIVAVGGTDTSAGPPGLAWRSSDGDHWTRISSPAVAAGVPQAVTSRDGRFIAVGVNANDTGSTVWSSPDGSTWTKIPNQESFQANGSPLRMAAVAPTASGLVAVGWQWDGGNGSAAVWQSADGTSWGRESAVPSFSGAKMDGVTSGPLGLVAVGTAGYPDNDQSTVWLGPG